MIAQPWERLQCTTGAVLILSFATMLAGALMFVNRRDFQPATESTLVPAARGFEQVDIKFVWERGFIMVAVILAAVGLQLLKRLLSTTGPHLLGRAGAYAYLLAAVFVLAAEAIRLRTGEKFYSLIVIYVVLALLAQAAIGGALLQSKVLPAWIGWATVVWNLTWLVVLPITTPDDIYFPVLHHLMPLLIGIALLIKAPVLVYRFGERFC